MPPASPDLTPDLLLRAYAAGIFPMAETRDSTQIHWVDPQLRGILPLDRFHTSRSLAKRIARVDWRIATDTDFDGVLVGCADRAETWINDGIRGATLALHARGHAHSLEVWESDDLVGGVYGVAMGAAFFGESMFSRRTDASKVALAWLVHRLRAGGFRLFDTQFLTPHLASLGAVEVSRFRYRALLAEAMAQSATWNPPGYSPAPVPHRSTQTS